MSTLKKTVILFYPQLNPLSTTWAPLSLLALAGPLQEAGYEVQLVDARVEAGYWKKIDELLPSAVALGLSCMTGRQIRDAIKLAAAVKQARPDLPIIWGGYHPTLMPQQTLRERYVDVVVRGQGQRTLLEVVQRLDEGRSLEGLLGISFKDSGVPVHNEARVLEGLEQFPSTPYGLVDMRPYLHHDVASRTTNYFSSQGCPSGCGFCADSSAYARRWAALPADRVADELERLKVDYGVNGIVFGDTNFFVDEKRVRDFCELALQRRLDLKWAADVRTSQFVRYDRDMLELLSRAGLKRVLVGAESGSAEVLRSVGKQTAVADTIKGAELCRQYGFVARFTTMLGFPDDPKVDIAATLDLVKRIKSIDPRHEVHAFYFAPYPGTPMYATALEHGFKEPASLAEWADFDLTKLHTPWVDRRLKRRLDALIEFYVPMASPGTEQREAMAGHQVRPLYSQVMHRIASARFRNNFFRFPVEWWLVSVYRRLKRLAGGAHSGI
jgi:anaerobic magnesium-protoporphyrin IX monomethyl ester cyclase